MGMQGLSIDAIIIAAHGNAVRKGFWDKPQAFGESIALIHSELSEALEDYRANKPMDVMFYEHKVNGEQFVSEYPVLGDTDEPSVGKPCGIPSELADAIIRICDLAGYHGIDLEQAIETKMRYNESRERMHGKIL